MILNRKKGNPQKLEEINLQRREKTLNSIRNAVEELEILGLIATIPRIMEITNLSRAAFDLTHIKELLQELRIGKYSKLKVLNQKNEISYDDYIEIHKQLNSKEKQIKKQKSFIESLKKKNEKLIEENQELMMKIYELELKKDLL